MTEIKKNIQIFKGLIEKSKTILILQPDGADGDSIGTALALEEILGDQGKKVVMFTYRDIDTYLQIHEGWDRIVHELPRSFDMTILVDAGSPMQLQATLKHHQAALASKPLVVIDHHAKRSAMPFETVEIIDAATAAAGEMIVSIAEMLGWNINKSAAEKLASAILSDSLNLTTPNTTAQTVFALGKLVEKGADLAVLYRRKREVSALTPELLKLKAELITTIEYLGHDDGLAVVTIPFAIIKQYDSVHSPGDLVVWDMMWTKGVNVAIVLSDYGDKVKGSMRAMKPIAGTIAESLGGGGHAGAAGFRLDKTPIDEAKKRLIEAYNKASQS